MPRKPVIPGVDRRQQILEAALLIFAQQGFEAATNKAIAELAGVNQGLIYFYFESKADVFFAAFEQHARIVMAQLDALYEQAGNENPATGLEPLLQQVVALLDTPRTVDLLRIMHQVVGSRMPSGTLGSEQGQRSIGLLAEHLATRLRAYLDAHIQQGHLRPLNAGAAAYLITRTLISSIGARGRGNGAQLSHQQLAEMIATLFCYGLLPRAEHVDSL